jgi:hypothetical protein
MTVEQNTSKTLNTFLWVAQGLLALALISGCIMKIFLPHQLPYPWVKDNPNLVLITGIVDLLGGLGIVLPALIRVQPKLTIFSAYGIIVLMVIASIFHISRGEGRGIGLNIFILLIAVFVAWGRQKKATLR